MKELNDTSRLTFTTGETCQLLGISRDLLYRLIKDGKIKALKVSRTCYRISRSAIEDWLDSF